jgi:hypothetical protein
MEYNFNNGEYVPSWQPRYLPESVPQNGQNMKVVWLPTPSWGVPEHHYPSRQQGPYQGFQDVPYHNFQAPPGRPFPRLQTQNLMAAQYQSLPVAPRPQEYNYSAGACRGSQNSSYHTSQAQSLPDPSDQSIEDLFSTNDTTGNEMPVDQDMLQLEDIFDIDMPTMPLELPPEENDMDTTPALVETPPDMCRSCGDYRDLKR